jgi:Apea-like HEPN
MNKDELIKALREAFDPTLPNVVTARKQASEIPPAFAEEREWFLHVVSRPVALFLSQSEPFKGGTGFLVQHDNGWTGFHANEASIALSRRVLEGQTPEQAVDWLERLLATRRADGIGVLALRGIRISAQVDLYPGLTLLPFSALPESSTKKILAAPIDLRAVCVSIPSSLTSPPETALTLAHAVEPYLHPAKNGHPPTQKDPHQCQSTLDDARLALTLVGPSCPVGAGYWFQFSDPDLAVPVLGSYILTSHQEILPWGFTPDVDIDPEEGKLVVSRFLSLTDPLRSTLRLSLLRFNQALRRPPHGDRAIDLAISLESLLVDGAGEITYKLGLRAGLLLGGSMERRQKVRAVVSALYTIRSALIHDGVLPKDVKVKGVGKQLARDVVEQATEICGQILRKVVLAGFIPNWYKFELGEPSSQH